MTRSTFGNTRRLRAVLTVVATTWASAAFAQEPLPPLPPVEAAPPGVEAQPVPPPPVEVAPVPPPPPPVVRRPAPEPDTSEVASGNDLDPELRPVGIGYAGVSQIPVGTVGNITAPAVGARIWVSQKAGIDIALGFGWADGSTKDGTTTTNLNAVYGFILQGGVPLALATHRHVSFQIIPNATFAYGQTKVSGGASPPSTISGKRFDLGARAGLEIFWGFIGLPQLSLSSTVGVAFEVRTTSTESSFSFNNSSATTYGISTTVQNNPWDIFTGNVAARYYF